ncbi:hypothetical protein F5Y05DRAFT_58548 [Hypoxylon sp. FL0543]|nr:hypothetical protein F5Y05DRAFT_58548 [Hypoxylon sp. FL0543]
MKNVGAILFLMASASSFAAATPVAQPADIAARALELTPATGTGSKVNGTGIAARSLKLTNANSTTLSTGAHKARSLAVPAGVNASDPREADLGFARRSENSSETGNEKRSPRLRRAHFALPPALNGTGA